MRLAIQLDDHLGSGAQKIDDVRRDRDLALELVAVKAAASDLLPKQSLCAAQHGPLALGEGAQAHRNLVHNASLLFHRPLSRTAARGTLSR
jgi:hypothetical protein